jgi:hypothetical protein
MSERRSRVAPATANGTGRLWLFAIGVALAVVVTGARCAANVRLGVDPASDAAGDQPDASADTRDGP